NPERLRFQSAYEQRVEGSAIFCGWDAADRLIREQFEKTQTVRPKLPFATSLHHQPAGRILLFFGLIDGEQHKLSLSLDFRGGPWDEFKCHGVEIQGNLVSGDSLLLRDRVGFDQRRITSQPGKIRAPDEHPAELGFRAQIVDEAELVTQLMLLQQD